MIFFQLRHALTLSFNTTFLGIVIKTFSADFPLGITFVLLVQWTLLLFPLQDYQTENYTWRGKCSSRLLRYFLIVA